MMQHYCKQDKYHWRQMISNGEKWKSRANLLYKTENPLLLFLYFIYSVKRNLIFSPSRE